jgi:hypothetical protein
MRNRLELGRETGYGRTVMMPDEKANGPLYRYPFGHEFESGLN